VRDYLTTDRRLFEERELSDCRMAAAIEKGPPPRGSPASRYLVPIAGRARWFVRTGMASWPSKRHAGSWWSSTLQAAAAPRVRSQARRRITSAV
jgi:hypothetical protein